MKGGENGLEDSEEWKDTMEDHSVADTDRQELWYVRLAIRIWRKRRWKEERTWCYWTRTG